MRTSALYSPVSRIRMFWWFNSSVLNCVRTPPRVFSAREWETRFLSRGCYRHTTGVLSGVSELQSVQQKSHKDDNTHGRNNITQINIHIFKIPSASPSTPTNIYMYLATYHFNEHYTHKCEFYLWNVSFCVVCCFFFQPLCRVLSCSSSSLVWYLFKLVVFLVSHLLSDVVWNFPDY